MKIHGSRHSKFWPIILLQRLHCGQIYQAGSVQVSRLRHHPLRDFVPLTVKWLDLINLKMWIKLSLVQTFFWGVQSRSIGRLSSGPHSLIELSYTAIFSYPSWCSQNASTVAKIPPPQYVIYLFITYSLQIFILVFGYTIDTETKTFSNEVELNYQLSFLSNIITNLDI